MSQINAFSRRHPLTGIACTGLFGKAAEKSPGIYIDIPPTAEINRVMPFHGKAQAINLLLQELYSMALPPAGKSHNEGRVTIAWAQKNCWYIMAPTEDRSVTYSRLKTALSGLAAVSDAGQGLIPIRIDGEDSRALIAKGCVLNLNHFLPGDSTPSLMAHTNIHLRRLSDRQFEILLPASHAASFWEWLCLSAAEFGYKVTFKPSKQVEKTDVLNLCASRPLKFG